MFERACVDVLTHVALVDRAMSDREYAILARFLAPADDTVVEAIVTESRSLPLDMALLAATILPYGRRLRIFRAVVRIAVADGTVTGSEDDLLKLVCGALQIDESGYQAAYDFAKVATDSDPVA